MDTSDDRMTEELCRTPEECLRVEPEVWARHVAAVRGRARTNLEAKLEAGDAAGATYDVYARFARIER
ncbi:MAG TPA: hypothetical protein VGR27_05055 [Longimicrobiaceae bacterium]|nr:hypothetical protein [Longimicrobiaceae bacterium]